MPNWTTSYQRTLSTRQQRKRAATAVLLLIWVVLIHREIINLAVATLVALQAIVVIGITGLMVWALIYLIGHPEALKNALRGD